MAIGVQTYNRGAYTQRDRLALSERMPRVSPLSARARTRIAMFVVAGMDLLALSALVVVLASGVSAWWVWAFPVASVVLLASCGHYEARIAPSVAHELRSLVACATAPLIVLALVRTTSIAFIVEAAVGAALAVPILHSLSYRAVRAMRSRGLLAERTLIVGAGQVGVTLSSTLERHPEYGLRPVGFLDDVDDEGLPLPLFGGVELLEMVLSEERIDRVVVAFGATREAEMLETIRACEDASVDIHVLPRFFELGVAVDGKDVDDVWGIPLVRLRRSLGSRCSRVAKRTVDVSLASLGLALSAPVYGLLAMAVKVSSPGPVYFRQKRVGQHGVLVDVLKFRTMEVHDGTDVEWTAEGDHVTKLGRLMRRLSLDELPQLWSIIRGDMSLVGPRPERPFFVEHFKSQVPHYDARHRVPVGLTGLAQVRGLRGDTSIDERARFDNRYIESWSLWRDLVIIFLTVFAVLRDAMPFFSSGDEDATQSVVANEVEDERCDLQPEVVVTATRPRPPTKPWYPTGSEWDQVASAG